MDKRMIGVVVIMVAALFLIGCNPVNVEPKIETGESKETKTTIATEENKGEQGPLEQENTPGAIDTENQLAFGEVPPALFELVLGDLLTTTGATRSGVEVVKSEMMIWSDGSLGCPQPGMMYTQALVDGYQVVFSLGGKEYDYHLSSTGSFVLCENTLPHGLSIE